jgi:predicted O-methyltransferase YrrM
MALALKDGQRENVIYTLDVDRDSLALAAAEATGRDVAERIVFIHGTVGAFARAYPQVRPAVTFVDGDHSRAGVDRDLAVLERIVPTGGLILFHDFADPRNADPGCRDTQVRPAIEASWVAEQCDFQGTFGVCGLYERRQAATPRQAGVAELMPLDGITDQYRYRLRYPAGRLLRRLAGKR